MGLKDHEASELADDEAGGVLERSLVKTSPIIPRVTRDLIPRVQLGARLFAIASFQGHAARHPILP